MPAGVEFAGFSPRARRFFADLIRNNNKDWFQEHRQLYEQEVLEPSRALVSALGPRLKKFAPQVNADPRVNKSLFRLNRDTRFSHDKSPYKDHLGIWFWEGPGARMDCSGFYFQLDPGGVMLAAGMHCFPRALLDPYRQTVGDAKQGAALVKAVAKVEGAGPYQVGGEHYKRTPRGYASDHPRARWLRHNGLYAMLSLPDPPEELLGPGLLDWCQEHFARLAPLHQWLLQLTNQAHAQV